MKAFLHYFQYEIRQLVHLHRRTVAILVCLPFIYTVLFGGMFYPSVVKNVPVGIVNLDTGMQSAAVIRELSAVPEVAVVLTTDDEQTGQDALAGEQIRALVIIPPDFSKDIGQYKGTTVAVLTNNTNTLLGGTAMKNIQPVLATYGAQVQVKQAIAAGITPPQAPQITMSLRSLYNSTGGYEDFFLAVLGIHALQIAIVFAVGPMWYLDIYRRRRDLAQHRMAIILAKLSAYTLVETIIFLGCLVLGHTVFDIVVRTISLELVGIIAAFSAAMTAFALCVGAAVRHISSTITLPLFYIMPSVLFSGAIWPRYSMDTISLGLTYIMPIGYSANTLRDILLRGTGPAFASDMMYLLIYTILMMGCTVLLVRRKVGKGDVSHVADH